MDIQELYQSAAEADVPVFAMDIPESGSMSLQTPQRCYIGMDYRVLDDEASARVHLAHELGHCITGAFYNRWAALDIRQKHENRANRWAYKMLIPREELEFAKAKGITAAWELAEYFEVTEPFLRAAVRYYEQR